jgi:hypothetical protein
MTDFGKLYTRVPKRVYARQWTPYSVLPYVENVFIDVPQPIAPSTFQPEDVLKSQDVTNYFQTVPKNIKVCINGIVTLGNGEKLQVDPLNYVLYSEVSQVPLSVITAEIFDEAYTTRFELCAICLAKSQAIRGGGVLPTFEDLIKVLEAGKTLTFEDGTVIKTFQDLQLWATNNGVPLG